MSAALPPRPLRLELALFAALALFVGLQWAALVADPPLARVIAMIAIATAGGAALSLARAGGTRSRRVGVGAAVAVAVLFAAFVVTGLPARLLLPVNWGELGDNLQRGLGDVADIGIPYDGGDTWVRLSILLGAPALVGLAALAAFWPTRSRAAGRTAAAVLLLALYVVAITWDSPSAEVWRGVVLLGLVAAWLWLPGMASRRLPAAVVAVAIAAAVAAPVATRLDSAEPIWDYRSWRLFSSDGISLGWEHGYGPLDWPQKGTIVLRVRSDRAHYWKTTSLDEFDGTGWRRSSGLFPEPPLGGAGTPRLRGPDGFALNARWESLVHFELRSLRSDLIVGAGTILGVRGAAGSPQTDGTWIASDELKPGEEYDALVYDPEPTATELRAAPTVYPREAARYTALTVPGARGGSNLRIPFWRRSGAVDRSARFEGTAYEGMYALARRLTAAAATPYDAAKSIESHLRSQYAYDQGPPEHPYPLPAFLFEDRAGYCQQFSGAMALMLRMVGIPSRVASGFAPGARRSGANAGYQVEDRDAHSWVEAYFPTLGWIRFEPTPGDAPAESQDSEDAAAADASGAVASINAPDAGDSASAREGESRSGAKADALGPGAGGGGGGGATAALLLGTGALALAAGGLYGWRVHRRRGLDPDSLAEAELVELAGAMPRLGLALPGSATLLEVEHALERRAGTGAAGYAARLRERRFGRTAVDPPRPAERRSLRRALIAAAGWRSIASMLRALPPGGPRPRGRARRGA